MTGGMIRGLWMGLCAVALVWPLTLVGAQDAKPHEHAADKAQQKAQDKAHDKAQTAVEKLKPAARVTGPVGTLDLTDDQKHQIRAIQEDAREKIKAVRQQERAAILAVLTPEQRAALEEAEKPAPKPQPHPKTPPKLEGHEPVKPAT